MASDGTLSHIYFFVNKDSTTTTTPTKERIQSPDSHSLSRSASPASAGSSDNDSGSGSSSSSASKDSALNPLAADFAPTFTAAPPTATKLYEVREIAGKGLGLFATSPIPRGTCIISEKPLLRISENALHLAWGPYCRLSNADKKAFDALHFYSPPHLHLEDASRMQLIDPTDSSMDTEDVDELVADQIRVMGTFACNNFQCGTGLAVFATTSRLNHSCVPNVHHSFNPTIGQQTVYAVRDIAEGEELCTTYLGGQGVYYVRAQRIEILRGSYGFTCLCAACADVTGGSDGRREVMGGIAYGLQCFQYGGPAGVEVQQIPYVPRNPAEALKQAEDLVCMLVGEGVLSIELCKAYRMASMVALNMREYERAWEYACHEADVERTCLGSELQDLVRSGAGATCWIEKIRVALVKAGRAPPAVTKRGGKTERQKAAKREKKMRMRVEKIAEKEAQMKSEREVAKEVKAAEKRAKVEAQREEERKRREYDAQFPGLKG
ncbi:hypothetical protein LTR56_019927 [Elasticomyces elasticus]|nr:hypothetical protein LTR56_019927 [Elasticomyces elasticus]KAK3643386.1 hypothetical protein LTR22_015689 [Elasticomyces elasticus]KAK4914014.1 hypothetical protein LTR49_017728 [Elasticomyces elasticus]KAK5755475.1 hypothetical protein LTS12_014460 [Elasticomyces elasticus]